MIVRIKKLEPIENFCLYVVFDDGKKLYWNEFIDLPSDIIYQRGKLIK